MLEHENDLVSGPYLTEEERWDVVQQYEPHLKSLCLFFWGKVEFEDALNELKIALFKALFWFNPARSQHDVFEDQIKSFVNRLSDTLYSSLADLNRSSHILYYSKKAYGHMNRVRQTRPYLRNKLGREPRLEEIADFLEIDLSKVRTFYNPKDSYKIAPLRVASKSLQTEQNENAVKAFLSGLSIVRAEQAWQQRFVEHERDQVRAAVLERMDELMFNGSQMEMFEGRFKPGNRLSPDDAELFRRVIVEKEPQKILAKERAVSVAAISKRKKKILGILQNDPILKDLNEWLLALN